jgi:ATP-binding cassette, subfamily B (MDR/TAP), member 1
VIIIIGGGGRMASKASKRVINEYSSAATVAEEVLSSIRTVQAFGTEEKLASLYDKNLQSAQQAGYRKVVATALLLASMFSSMYLLYGLAFCNRTIL